MARDGEFSFVVWCLNDDDPDTDDNDVWATMAPLRDVEAVAETDADSCEPGDDADCDETDDEDDDDDDGDGDGEMIKDVGDCEDMDAAVDLIIAETRWNWCCCCWWLFVA